MRYVLCLVLTALALATPAQATNSPSAVFDNAATFIAGHPVTVNCETDWSAWIANGSSEDNGYTVIGTPVIYVGPRQCETLHALIQDMDVGAYYASSALLTLAHESVHQRGITDEGVTDCTALALVPQLATKFFDIPSTVSKTVIRIVRRKIGKRFFRVPVLKTIRVTNPFLSSLASYALKWHRQKPPAYQGSC